MAENDTKEATGGEELKSQVLKTLEAQDKRIDEIRTDFFNQFQQLERRIHEHIENRLSQTHSTEAVAIAAKRCPNCGSPAHEIC